MMWLILFLQYSVEVEIRALLMLQKARQAASGHLQSNCAGNWN